MNEIQKSDKKTLRRKVQQKIKTIIKKAADLESQGYEILIIARYKESSNWTFYSTDSAESIFFSFQNARKQLENFESVSKKCAQLLDGEVYSKRGFIGPEPVKLVKCNDDVENFQTIFTAENFKLEDKMQQSALSTDFKSIDNQSVFSSTVKNNDKPCFNFEENCGRGEEKSSPDFDFESYFAGYS